MAITIDRDGTIWAPDHGVYADGIDRSEQLQALLDEMYASANGVKAAGFSNCKIRFDGGTTFASGDWSKLPSVMVCGAGKNKSVLVSQNPVATIYRTPSGTVPVDINDIKVVNNTTGDAVNITGIFGASVRRVSLSSRGGNGWVTEKLPSPAGANTSLHFQDCDTIGCAGSGLKVWGRMKIDNHLATGCGIGMNLSGTIDLRYARLEENVCGLATYGCVGSFSCITSEANITHYRCGKSTNHCVFTCYTILGDMHDGTISPDYGIDISGDGALFLALSINTPKLSGFSKASIRVTSTAGDFRFEAPDVSNAGPVGKVWDVANPSIVRVD